MILKIHLRFVNVCQAMCISSFMCALCAHVSLNCNFLLLVVLIVRMARTFVLAFVAIMHCYEAFSDS